MQKAASPLQFGWERPLILSIDLQAPAGGQSGLRRGEYGLSNWFLV